MWTRAGISAHQRGKATAEKWEESIARLEEMAKHMPALAERVRDLRNMRDQLDLATSTALAIDSRGDD